MKAGIVWLEGPDVDPAEVGVRAAVLSRLRTAGVPVPRGFALGRSLLREFSDTKLRHDRLRLPAKLPADVQRDIGEALSTLGGSFAIRRSPLEEAGDTSGDWATSSQGGRPERETYLHLTDAAEVSEAVRRIWGQGLVTSPPPPSVAIVVQRFLAPDVSAVVRRDGADPDLLHVVSTLGVGDLLAAGLVVPDRHTLRRDGSMLSAALGRKAQMSVPRGEGGIVRVPIPAHAARRYAIPENRLAEVAATWRQAEAALDGLLALGVASCAGRWHVTSAAVARPAALDSLMLG